MLRSVKRFLQGTTSLPADFTFIPDFLSLPEQKLLLRTALKQLDDKESRRSRLRRKGFVPSLSEQNLDTIFLPDAFYEFEEGHFDGVIRRFREIHLTAWPQDILGLSPILDRLHSLLPTQVDIQTHLLHLASDGRILPHIDNADASGTWIFGVSLGSERILRMIGPDISENFDVLLPSGSVYLQRDSLRYNYSHSILESGVFHGRVSAGGQRLSIMIRDRKSLLSN